MQRKKEEEKKRKKWRHLCMAVFVGYKVIWRESRVVRLFAIGSAAFNHKYIIDFWRSKAIRALQSASVLHPDLQKNIQQPTLYLTHLYGVNHDLWKAPCILYAWLRKSYVLYILNIFIWLNFITLSHQ